jgi:hypothetical protein
MSVKTPNSKRHLDDTIARIVGLSEATRVRILVANVIIGQMLPGSVVKGGSALKLRYGNSTTRFTRDLDAARADNLQDFLAEFEPALSTGWNGFTGYIVERKPAQPKNVPEAYIMQPFEIKLSYKDKSWLTIPLEIGNDEIGDTDAPDYSMSPEIIGLFESIGLPEPKAVALMPIHHQIAQKLHAVSLLDSERAHDLIDLQIIAANEDIDFPLVKTTCQRLFASRRQQVWPPTVIVGQEWQALYEEQSSGLDIISDVEGAVAWVNELIKRIDA